MDIDTLLVIVKINNQIIKKLEKQNKIFKEEIIRLEEINNETSQDNDN